ncbi:MAG TPA: UDP-N-acetylmuramoyl-L-alanyl-D-glutamate--2,6-diaminopimelate ligase, partial [Candidatus Limnocylindrales bacterium]|nr:UDP-N-acetylmuramoyl-L-alanyl-D-glutamate--2,6-diaminopimelate ligase [Candidatus Limnocylindrales bacterium]
MNPKKLVRKVLPKKGITLAEESYRKSRVYALQARYGFPAKGLRIIAVTGTNGKTTTCCYINEVLKAAGCKTAMYTTAVIEMNGKAEPNKTHRSVALTAKLLGFLKSAKEQSVDFVVLEVTSMALHQHKLIGLPIEVAVMTNLTQDHLDYHKTMERYAEAKARLFNRYLKPRHCILNSDDEWYGYFLNQSVGQVTDYGQQPDSKVRIQGVIQEGQGSTWQLVHQGQVLALQTKLSALFNVYNATAAAAVGLTLGLPEEAIVKGIAALNLVPGRMESIDEGQDFTVWVDFAVTPDALQKVLQAGKYKGRVSIVFGATGDRDKAKRPIMGQIAATYADRIYLTDDETYTEDPESIRQAVYEGIAQARGEAKTKVIADRYEAIKTAFKEAKKGDVVILAGMGHEDFRNMGGKPIPW